jgi:hypothetical protein
MKSNEAVAKWGMDLFIEVMTQTSPHMKREFKVVEQDEDHVDFQLDNYDFTLGWSEAPKQSIGRDPRWVVQYSLCIWHTEYGGRSHPPETVDTTLVETESIWDCIRVAYTTVYKDELRQVLEGYSYSKMEDEEKNLETA